MPDERQHEPGLAKSADLPAVAPWHDVRTRSAHEIPKPKDWQALQRGCVILFQAELKDTHAQEYGRNGQGQYGIDVLGRRDGNSDHFVGVQCRRLDKPMKKDEIFADCRASLSIKAGLKEIIFATTCPSDVHATNAAIEVERELRAEGHDLKVVLYSWSDIELKLAQHPVAYSYFFPGGAAAPAAPGAAGGGSGDEGRRVTARNYFVPELSRIIAQQAEALERLTTNFSAASVKKPEQAGCQLLTLEQMVLMKPPLSRLYPNAPQFADLSPDDVVLLTEFYDSLEYISDTIDRWIIEKIPMDGNAFNVMMQTVQKNLETGEALITRFCPDRLLNSKYPAWGTLLARVRLLIGRAKDTLHRHLARHNALGPEVKGQ